MPEKVGDQLAFPDPSVEDADNDEEEDEDVEEGDSDDDGTRNTTPH